MTLSERLHQKGWTPAEIEQTLGHLKLAEERKEPLVRFSEVSTYWLLLIAIIISVAATSVLLLPFLDIIPKELSFIIFALIGAVFGVLYAHVLHDIERLEHRHHVFVLLITVASALGWSWKATGGLVFGGIFAALFSAQYVYYWYRK
jgi:hypothetical protein